MDPVTLFQNDSHKNILLEDADSGEAVQANQHLIIHDGHGMILDPGGHKVYNRVLSETHNELGQGNLDYVFLSHQDPDIVAALNGWLMTTDARALAPSLWTRFIPHFGLDDLFISRLEEIPDAGKFVDLGGAELMILPAHFLHSCGNYQVYDPISKILYTGDLGASLGVAYREVTDFEAHRQFMDGFHQRYMTSGNTMKAWAAMVRDLDIETIAPQHGAVFRGRGLVERFLDWAIQIDCGIDHLTKLYKLPTRE